MKKDKKVKAIECTCCHNEIQKGDEEAWRSNDGLFCSMECLARWYGDQMDEQVWEEYDEA